MIALDPVRRQDSDKIYELFVKPLEKSHYGDYVIVTPEGQNILGCNLSQAIEKAQKISQQNNYIFKVGDKVIGKLR